VSAEFFEKYSHKVKTVDELKSIVGALPRRKKLIMCHGVFDVVHPGHVRHLAYAKSKAKTLVVSITADKHISKGAYRPHIPERLRALNLAAFEMVDYVIIDDEAKPLKNLAAIKPDYFAKGFEYTSAGLPPATEEEAAVVEGYGGQMIFTPGDVVYSSTKFITSALPQVQIDKLLLTMKTHGVTFDALRKTLSMLSQYRVHVIGDTIVDSYTRTTMIGGQTKTPTFSVLYQGRDDYIGGAGIVSQHMRAAGAEVVFSTVLGDDPLKDFVVDGLKASGVDVRPIVDATRPTTNKNAIIAGGYRLLKVDTLDNRPISDAIRDRLSAAIGGEKADAVVFSDFRHGIFNRWSLPVLAEAIPSGVYKVADSQVASRWGNITEFRGFDLVTPNEREARFALGDQDSTVGSLAAAVLEACDCQTLMLKLGDRGVFCLMAQPAACGDAYFSIDSFAGAVLDAVGAGDALLAYSTLAMLATRNHVIAAVLGSIAAACECEIDGNVPVKPENVLAKLDAVERMSSYSA
jgi:rfaE bifunctional protein kinase chain/domain